MFTSLHHVIDRDWMHEAYRRTRKDGAAGVDGVTAADYETDLEANLESLLDRIKFLGFTHVWGRTRKGGMAVRQITAKNRCARAVKAVHDWCKRHRHLPIKRRQEHLSRVLRGHCGYYGLTGNHKRLGWFRRQMIRSWRTWLSRRCRAGHLNWGRMDELLRTAPAAASAGHAFDLRHLSEPDG